MSIGVEDWIEGGASSPSRVSQRSDGWSSLRVRLDHLKLKALIATVEK